MKELYEEWVQVIAEYQPLYGTAWKKKDNSEDVYVLSGIVNCSEGNMYIMWLTTSTSAYSYEFYPCWKPLKETFEQFKLEGET